MSKYRISLFENCYWNTPSPETEEEILSHFSRVISELNESSVKKQILFGVNDITKAIENDVPISLVILFRPNVPTTIIRHIPLICRTKKIDYLGFLKNTKISCLHFKNISCLAIKHGECERINSIVELALKIKF
ncbi:Ribosomal protein L7Ae/L30e/S12e/Gadd45 family protein [Theileria parva strain Muguga]|uniref:Ribosomal protein eL8/eL30/eS12/Gadd45 domain-containing protein n=1 Tax=Theileria parva TaxID=5875 RepID=Q4N881_THEPA|nr:Ribosomal protein L7Ae/L30e/S12e/Gadd45 family protein [Theileria parva strain Muguga]EAN33827.1 Ribosomal protein L7Ae/L30e/S12e/Gadd45 family protein [Theileria parva strain Muguga]|eukprot:XP_766110.1 hypothetical protein [Theileria parva strain Muguga]